MRHLLRLNLLDRVEHFSDDRNEHRASHVATEMMVFEEIIRYSPRRRASPRIAEGFSPTARGVYRIKFSISISPTASWV